MSIDRKDNHNFGIIKKRLSKNDNYFMATVFPFLRLYFFFPLIRKFWQVRGDYSLLLELADFVVLQNLIIMCIFVASRTN